MIAVWLDLNIWKKSCSSFITPNQPSRNTHDYYKK
jgi:hypothetical protein